MNFRPELAAAVMRGEKTVTRRLLSNNPRSPWFKDRCRHQPGKPFKVCPDRSKHNIGSAIVTSVRKQRLGRLSDAEARREGFPNADAFEAGFAGINGFYDPDIEVWRIEFSVGLASAAER